MRLTTGKVRQGKVELDENDLPEGTTVVVLASESDEIFEIGPAEEAKLRAAIEEVARRSAQR